MTGEYAMMNFVGRPAIIGGIIFFLLIWAVLLPTKLSAPSSETFYDDPGDYNLAAVHLAQDGFYSVDGVHPFYEREPGYSTFLAAVYVLFGRENRIAIFAMQGFLFLYAALFFFQELSKRMPGRIPKMAFLLLMVTAPVYHAVFSAYREGFALTLFLVVGTFFLRWRRTHRSRDGMLLGLSLGCLILTYFSYVFLPLFLLPILWIGCFHRKERLIISCFLVLIPYTLLSLWVLRNALQTDYAVMLGRERTSIMWYVRGEQAEHLRGMEPFLCLWSEYISRDWTDRSPYCSTNGVVHIAVEQGVFKGDLGELTARSQEKILRYFPHYLWFSVFEVLEFHLPYVNGWGLRYNTLAAMSVTIIYIGCLLSLRSIWKKDYAVFLLVILYGTLVFSLTDATPRYNIPTLFAYTTIAAVGYDRFLTWMGRNLLSNS